jgi:hypothetical protein
MPAKPAQKKKPCTLVAPYAAKPGPKGPHASKDAPKTSAGPAKRIGRQNLTLSDWINEVFPFYNSHQAMTQEEIAAHFRTHAEGPLEFNATRFARNSKKRPELEAQASSFANALSSKWLQAVTRPDVDMSLKLWFNGMMDKGEIVSGPMLSEKRRRFEDLLQVPENERMKGSGWIAPFQKA